MSIKNQMLESYPLGLLRDIEGIIWDYALLPWKEELNERFESKRNYVYSYIKRQVGHSYSAILSYDYNDPFGISIDENGGCTIFEAVESHIIDVDEEGEKFISISYTYLEIN